MSTHNNAVVAIFPSHTEAESAATELQHSGFDMAKLSIVGRDSHPDENEAGCGKAGDRMKYWGIMGALCGALLGGAFFHLPGFGHLLTASLHFGWFAAAFEGALIVGGLGVIGAGLYSHGIPNDLVLQYETGLKTGKFIVSLSTVGAGLHFFGIPHDRVLQYEAALKTGKFAVIAHGSLNETAQAQVIMNGAKPEALEEEQRFLRHHPGALFGGLILRS